MTQTRRQNIVQEGYQPGDRFSGTAVGAITGCRFLMAVTGGVGNHPNVSVATAGAATIGVAGYDCVAGDTQVPVHNQGCFTVKVGSGGVTAGGAVQSDATGQAIALASGVKAGVAVTDAAAGALAYIQRP